MSHFLAESDSPEGLTEDILCQSGGAASPYRMISTFQVTNFRCFQRIQLENLTRVNIVTGSNASGKTALLESIIIGAVGSPEGLIRAARLRATEAIIITPQNFRNFWAPWFRNDKEQIVISYADDVSATRVVKIYFSAQAVATGASAQNALRQGSTITPLVVERISADGKTMRMAAILNQQGQLTLQGATQNLGPVTYFFPATLASSETDNVAWFSDLKINNKADEVVSYLIQEFPFIKDLEVLAPGGVQGIYAKLDNNTTRPLSQVSSGIHKMLSICSGIAATENGVVLVDEIENGIHYEKYGATWRGIYQLAKRHGNQLFVSSHSEECLKALLPLLEAAPEDFSLLRTERVNGVCTVHHRSGKSMRAALERGGEVRGATVGGPQTN